MTGQFSQTSVRGKLRTFFEQNPDEELERSMVHAKFGKGKWNAADAIAVLVKEGFLESVHVVRRKAKGVAK